MLKLSERLIIIDYQLINAFKIFYIFVFDDNSIVIFKCTKIHIVTVCLIHKLCCYCYYC